MRAGDLRELQGAIEILALLGIQPREVVGGRARPFADPARRPFRSARSPRVDPAARGAAARASHGPDRSRIFVDEFRKFLCRVGELALRDEQLSEQRIRLGGGFGSAAAFRSVRSASANCRAVIDNFACSNNTLGSSGRRRDASRGVVARPAERPAATSSATSSASASANPGSTLKACSNCRCADALSPASEIVAAERVMARRRSREIPNDGLGVGARALPVFGPTRSARPRSNLASRLSGWRRLPRVRPQSRRRFRFRTGEGLPAPAVPPARMDRA